MMAEGLSLNSKYVSLTQTEAIPFHQEPKIFGSDSCFK